MRFDATANSYTMTVPLKDGDDLVERLLYVDHWSFDSHFWSLNNHLALKGSGDLTVWIDDEATAIWWRLRWTP